MTWNYRPQVVEISVERPPRPWARCVSALATAIAQSFRYHEIVIESTRGNRAKRIDPAVQGESMVRAMLVAGVLSMCGCSGALDHDAGPAVTARPEGAPAETVRHVEPVPEEDISLVVDPGSIASCAGQRRVASSIEWRAGRGRHIEIHVRRSEGAARKLFATGGGSGTARAGEWVKVGTVFEMVDADTGGLLKRHVMTEKACP